MTHYSEDQWLDYADGAVDSAEASAMGEHLVHCTECRTMHDGILVLQTALGDPYTWEVCTAFDESETRLPVSLRTLAERVDAEREAAEERLHAALASPTAFVEAHVAEDSANATSGTVEVLTAAARAVRQRQPQFAVSLATAATKIGERLEREGKLRSPSLLTYAWIERAAASFFCGRYRDAAQCLDAAAPLLEGGDSGAEFDRAIVELLRATVYVETERPDEGAAEAALAAVRFSEFGDERNAIGAKLIAGTVAFYRREYARAAALYEELVHRARASAETTALAHALASAAAAYIKLGRYDRAEKYLLEVLPLWDELGFDLNRLRAEWVLAVARGYQGEFDESIAVLNRAIAELEALGAMHDGAVARLDLADILSLAGRTDAIALILDGVVLRFASEGISQRAKQAIAFLREALRAGRADVELIRHVREYVDRLPSQPQADFRPPA